MEKKQEKLTIVVIMGSVRPGRFCDTITQWVAGQLKTRQEFDLRIVDPAKLPLPGWADLQESEGAVELRRQLAAADAFVIVTPEYNHSFSAALKSVIDMAYQEWQAKPVGFVSYGGTSGGLRAVEQLRLVFAELHAVTMRDSVSFAFAWNQFTQHGELINPQSAEGAMTRMVAKLQWWATALRQARREQTYTEAA